MYISYLEDLYISFYMVQWYEGISIFKIPDVVGAELEGKQTDSEIISFTYSDTQSLEK